MIWKTIEEKWLINNEGQVKSISTGKLLKIRLRKDGYLDVKLSHKRHLVHRLVAKAFIPNPLNFKQVNHIDGNRSNACLSNLEWVNQEMNMKHAFALGLFGSRKGEKNFRCIITEAQAIVIKDMLKGGWKASEIARRLNISPNIVYNIKRGLSWRHI